MNLSVQIFIALALAAAVGLFAGPSGAPFIKEWISPIGSIFISLIKMMIVPVVLCSLVTGIASVGDPKKLGRMGLKTVIIYFITTIAAICIGFASALAISPGKGLDMSAAGPVSVPKPEPVMQIFVNMVPASPVESMAKGDILPIIVFAVFLGIGIVSLGGEKGKKLSDLFDAGAEMSYKVISMIMNLAPFGVFALLLPVIAEDGSKLLMPLASVIACVAIASVVHVTGVYSVMARIWGKISPLKFFQSISEAMLVAFTTCSTAAALPVNMKNCQEKLGISKEVTGFVLPLGATVNMDGTALYCGVCSVFIANAFGIGLTVNQFMMILLTGTLASVGTAGVPGAGLIMLTMVLQSAGLPIEGIAIVAGIDRILDMFRTWVNNTGNSAVAAVVDRTVK